MPAPNLRLTSGVRAGGDRLYDIVREQIAAELAAAARAETLRAAREKEGIERRRTSVQEQEAGIKDKEAGIKGREATTKEGEAKQRLAEWQYKLDNPETEVVRGVAPLTGGKATVELVRKLGGAPVRTLGYDYNVTPQTQFATDQIATEGPNKGRVVSRLIDERDPNGTPLYESPQYVRPVTGSGSGGGDEVNANAARIATMVMGNPELLKEMNPTLKGQVLGEIARQPEPFRLGRQRMLDQTLAETEQAIVALQTHPGVAGAVGQPSITDPGSLGRWIPGMGGKSAAGSKAAGAEQGISRLVALLTSPKMELLRGMGPMSDRDLSNIQAMATTLSGQLEEPEFRAELDRMLKHTREARARATMTQTGPVAPSTAHGAPGAPGAAPRPVLDAETLRRMYP